MKYEMKTEIIYMKPKLEYSDDITGLLQKAIEAEQRLKKNVNVTIKNRMTGEILHKTRIK